MRNFFNHVDGCLRMSLSLRPSLVLLSVTLLLVGCQVNNHVEVKECGSVVCEYPHREVCATQVKGNVSQLWDGATVYIFAADEQEYKDFLDVKRLTDALESKFTSARYDTNIIPRVGL